MRVQKFGSHFLMLMAARQGKASIIPFNEDGSDAGLYLPGFVNDRTKTSFAARGSVEDLEHLLSDLRS